VADAERVDPIRVGLLTTSSSTVSGFAALVALVAAGALAR
jgi:hypothetical protein